MGAQSMTRLQSICHKMAIIDLLLYFGTLITSYAVENAVSEFRPMVMEISDNGTVSVSYGPKNELMAIWDYLDEAHYTSSGIYNAVYMTLVLLAASYLIIEVWLSCVLIRGSSERSVSHCKKWFWWRICLMFLTVLVAASDLYQMQYTLTLLLLIPINIYRVTLLILVKLLINDLLN